MDAEEILAQANTSAELPAGWSSFPLLKGKVIWGIVGWIFGILMGAGLLALIVPIVIPVNFQHGTFSIILTTFLLAILAFIFFGSIYMLIIDIVRVAHPEQHMIVLTPTDFVMREGAKTTQVPLKNVRHVTPRGRAPIDRSADDAGVRNIQGAGENVFGFIFGRGTTESGQKQRRKRVRTPTSLAFVDDRTDTEVTVVNDNAHGDPFLIAAVIKKYVAGARSEESIQK
ncbi:hypothetical protein [Dictyobacter kobayashii]|uniref:Uncharacterized protein n=1 Tax=Dictyobacter kobayashii TaxID=2014872 RepID=A0A402AG12_9CHLR|nr:hypothetical protein [Dictyobacter kobayashii]GCE18060.1 hypothetical protein KDK_18600 [Dictyobacter kobayashii]